MALSKQQARQDYKACRLALSEAAIAQYSQEIHNTFFREISLEGLRTVHLFLPILAQKEINTWPILQSLWQYEGLQVLSPRNKSQSLMMEHCLTLPSSTYRRSAWGIPEVAENELLPPEQIDLVLVPLLVCDLQGHRVGYGKGFYDYFLKECRPDVRKIGLSIFEPVEELSDVAPHDIALDACVTPQKIYHF